jgi:hypothetical protein
MTAIEFSFNLGVQLTVMVAYDVGANYGASSDDAVAKTWDQAC